MHGVTINPIAFLVIQSNNVKLIPVNHSSSIDKLLDYMPDLIDKTNNMMNKIVNNKREETEKILKEMQKRSSNINSKTTSDKSKEIKQELKNQQENVKKYEDINFEYEYDDTQEDD